MFFVMSQKLPAHRNTKKALPHTQDSKLLYRTTQVSQCLNGLVRFSLCLGFKLKLDFTRNVVVFCHKQICVNALLPQSLIHTSKMN